MPTEVVNPRRARLRTEIDPETGDRYVRVRLPLPPRTALGRARELGHMLTSVLAGVGYTVRQHGAPVEELPGEHPAVPEASFGGAAFAGGRVCSAGCGVCVVASQGRVGCCAEGAAFSLADLGAMLLSGEDQLVATALALPGEMDGEKWHPYLSGGRCVFHDQATGCTLPRTAMPLQCRTYLCTPAQLLPPDLLAAYDGYVANLEDQEASLAAQMREAGVDFGSPLAALRAAAAQAFTARTIGDRNRSGALVTEEKSGAKA
jgi:hypothetical protein